MTKLVVLITSQVEQSHTVGEAWQTLGAPGVTLIEGHGLRHLQEAWKHAEILPNMFSLQRILRENDLSSVIVLSLLDDDTLVDRLITATEGILGDMTAPNNGVMFVIDLARVIGVHNHNR
ncbi:MAG: hypothetical protein ACYDBJ_03030 [Aggregatilineales bacterium]